LKRLQRTASLATRALGGEGWNNRGRLPARPWGMHDRTYRLKAAAWQKAVDAASAELNRSMLKALLRMKGRQSRELEERLIAETAALTRHYEQRRQEQEKRLAWAREQFKLADDRGRLPNGKRLGGARGRHRRWWKKPEGVET
jgi:hypothetical protein